MEAENLGKPPNYNDAMATNLPGNVMPNQPATYHQPTSNPMATNLPGNVMPTQPATYHPPTSNPNSNLPGPHIVTQQPQQVFVATVTPQNSKFPCFVHCQKCNKTVSTKVSMETSLYTHLIAGTICFFGGWIFCFLIPYFTDFSKDAVHKCPKCGTHLGTCLASRRF